MIIIKHIEARLPNNNCEIKFLLKEKVSTSPDTPSIYPFTGDTIKMDLDIQMEIPQEDRAFELCVVAVTEGHKIYIGGVDVQPGDTGEFKSSLKGITEQDGFLIYQVASQSPRKEPTKRSTSRQQG